MKVRELIEELKKVHPDIEVQIARCENDFDDLYGLSDCEEGKAIILCDKNTFMAYMDGVGG